MEDFKQYLSDDADKEERAAAERVRAGLAGLRLENKVAEVAAERRTWLRRRLWQRVVLGATLLLLVGAAFLFFRKKETLVPPSVLPQEQTVPQQQIKPSTPPQQQSELQKRQPIAERPRSPREQDEQPLVRSVQPGLDTSTNRLIDLLLKMTVHNDPSKNLDTNDQWSHWGDAVRLLRQNKPAEAKRSIFKMIDRGGSLDWDAQWLLGIALLEDGKPDEAQAIFEKIAKDPGNPRRKDAQLAAEALR